MTSLPLAIVYKKHVPLSRGGGLYKMEARTLRVMFNKDGRGVIGTKITLPITWVRDMGVSPEDRDVNVEYDEEKKEITIKKL